MITPNCRERLTAADFEFIVRTLSRRRSQDAPLAELLTHADTRDTLLDSDALFQAVVEAGDTLRISPQFYFYVLLRHVLKEHDIASRETCDYLASLLEKFSRTERMRAPGGAGEGTQQYVSDLLLALNRANPAQAFLLRAHIGNYTLFITGVFHERVEHRSRRGGPDVEFFEGVGASNFDAASEHPLARQNALTPIYEELGERFRDIRLALNEATDRLLHMEDSTEIILP